MQPDTLPSDSPFRLAKLGSFRRLRWPQMRLQIIIEPQQIRVFPEMACHVVGNNGFHPVGESPRQSRPPTAAELRQAKWGIGGQGVGLHDGKVWPGSNRQPDSRTAIGIDAERRLLFLAVAQWASPYLVLERLAQLGARDAMLLDGGSSSAMAIGEGARGLARGALFGGSRPVATFFGVMARRLSAPQGG